MSETRLTGLALLNIHRDIDTDIEKVIERSFKNKKIKITVFYLNCLKI